MKVITENRLSVTGFVVSELHQEKLMQHRKAAFERTCVPDIDRHLPGERGYWKCIENMH